MWRPPPRFNKAYPGPDGWVGAFHPQRDGSYYIDHLPAKPHPALAGLRAGDDVWFTIETDSGGETRARFVEKLDPAIWSTKSKSVRTWSGGGGPGTGRRG